MIKEWSWKSHDGHRFFHAGFGSMSAVGAEKPSDEIPLQEGLRLLFAKGIDRWAVIFGAAFFLRRIFKKKRRRKQ